MALTAWSSFYDFVRPEIPAVEAALVDAKLREAAMEFCEETLVHTVDFAAVDIVANQATYTLATPIAGTDPVEVKWAWALLNNSSNPNGYQLFPVSMEELSHRPTYWPNDTSDSPQRFTQPDQNTVQLYPKPTVSYPGGLLMKVALKPTSTASGLQDWVATRYIREIAFGAKAMLMEMDGKPWSNMDGAKRNRALFEGAKTKAIIEANRNFTRGQMRVQMSRNW